MEIIGRRGQRAVAHRMLHGMIDVQQELQAIRERNHRVEMEKAWEISRTRRFFIAVITWCTATLFLWLIDVSFPCLNALVPTGGYLLSTLSLPWVKRRWMRRKVG